MFKSIQDQLGHEIYLTDERWTHICEEHPEMTAYENQVLATIERGRRFQDSVRPDLFLYDREFDDLPLATPQSLQLCGSAFDRMEVKIISS